MNSYRFLVVSSVFFCFSSCIDAMEVVLNDQLKVEGYDNEKFQVFYQACEAVKGDDEHELKALDFFRNIKFLLYL